MNLAIRSIPILLLGATAVAQSVVVPSAAATTKPNPLAYNYQTFYSTSSTTTPHDARSQLIYDVNDISLAAGVFKSLQVRRPVGLGNANPAFTATLVIQMSVSPNVPDAASTTFASNHGTPMTVYSGPMSLPAVNNPPTWPAAWETAFVFTVPFPYAKPMGKSLVIDITQTGNTATTPWYLEATQPDLGSRVTNGTSPVWTCKFSNGNVNNSIGHRNPYVGGTWSLTYYNLLPNVVGFAAIGAQGVGGTWGSLTLPVDLTPFGAPTCTWNVSADFVQPMTANATGSASWPNVSVPNTPALAGQAFFDHSLWIDPPANAWGVVTAWSSKWIVGTNIGAPGATVYANGTQASGPTGSFSRQTVPTLQLNQ